MRHIVYCHWKKARTTSHTVILPRKWISDYYQFISGLRILDIWFLRHHLSPWSQVKCSAWNCLQQVVLVLPSMETSNITKKKMQDHQMLVDIIINQIQMPPSWPNTWVKHRGQFPRSPKFVQLFGYLSIFLLNFLPSCKICIIRPRKIIGLTSRGENPDAQCGKLILDVILRQTKLKMLERIIKREVFLNFSWICCNKKILCSEVRKKRSSVKEKWKMCTFFGMLNR